MPTQKNYISKLSDNLVGFIKLALNNQMPLMLRNLGVYDAFVPIICDSLSKNPSILAVNLSMNPITGSGVKELVQQCPWVTDWDFSETSIDDSAVQVMLANPNIKRLSLKSNGQLTDISGVLLVDAYQRGVTIVIDAVSHISPLNLEKLGINDHLQSVGLAL